MTIKEQSVVDTLNMSTQSYPKDMGIHELFSVKAGEFPDQIATSSSLNSYTYSQVDRLSSALAGELQKRGVREGNFVGVCLPRILGRVDRTLIASGQAELALATETSRDQFSG